MSLNVLYLDDEAELCEIFFDEFSSENVQIKTFTDPQKALAEVHNNPPDLIFLDYRLPGITGEQVAKAMPLEIPKYLISGDIAIETDYKFVGIFSKPTKSEHIQAVLDSMLKSSRTTTL